MEHKDYFELIRRELNDGNKELFSRVRKNDHNIFSVEFVSMAFADFLIEDLEFILENFSPTGNQRFASIIFRSMVEHIALYGYLMKNPTNIVDYIAGSDEEVKLKYKGNNLVRELKKTTESRWSKPSVKTMCLDIKEVESNSDKLSLYDIYCISSDSIHDSYFEEMDRIMQTLDRDANLANSYDFEMTMLILSLNVFYKIYEQILKDA